MNKRVTLIMVVVLGLTTLAGAVLGCAGGRAEAQFEPAAAVDLNAGLLGNVLSPEVTGRAAYGVNDRGAAELEVAVRAAGTAAGRMLNVFIDGTPAGSVTLDNNGQGQLRAAGEVGQSVPAVTAGSTIEVRQDDRVIASGQFLATGDDTNSNANDNNSDDNANDNSSDDNANDNGSDDNANDNSSDDNANDNGSDDNANDNSDDNANDNSDDNDNDSSDDNDNGSDDNDNDNHDDDNDNASDDNDNGDDVNDNN